MSEARNPRGVRAALAHTAARGHRPRHGRPRSRHRGATCARPHRGSRAHRCLLDQDPDRDRHLLRRRTRCRAPVRTGRDGVALSDRPACDRRLGGCAAPVCDLTPLSAGARARRFDHGRDRHPGRSAGAAHLGAPPGADHAHVRRGDHARGQHPPLPERRRRLSGRSAGWGRSQHSSTGDRNERYGVLPLHGDRRRRSCSCSRYGR